MTRRTLPSDQAVEPGISTAINAVTLFYAASAPPGDRPAAARRVLV